MGSKNARRVKILRKKVSLSEQLILGLIKIERGTQDRISGHGMRFIPLKYMVQLCILFEFYCAINRLKMVWIAEM